MTDNKPQPENTPENKADTLEKQQVKQTPDTKEIHEAKTSVGMETGEIIEGAEISSGQVSESEKKKKESYSGETKTGKTAGQTRQITKQSYPSTKKMSSQIEKELKKDIRDLQRKVKMVMRKKGQLDAARLNTLMAKLRQLKETLASLAYATADTIREMWHKYVKNER